MYTTLSYCISRAEMDAFLKAYRETPPPPLSSFSLPQSLMWTSAKILGPPEISYRVVGKKTQMQARPIFSLFLSPSLLFSLTICVSLFLYLPPFSIFPSILLLPFPPSLRLFSVSLPVIPW